MFIIYFLLFLLVSKELYAIPCYVTVLKDKCWENYHVSVQVRDAFNKQNLAVILIPKGQLYGRARFECSSKQGLDFWAEFTPVFWENDKGKVYRIKSFIFMPEKLRENEIAWHVPICFSSHFSGVPLPPTGGANCICDFSSVPSVDSNR